MSSVRIDKWLWAVRLCKTRSLASAACRMGRVRAGGHEVRASRDVRPGDVITLQQEDLTRTVRVKAVLENRVGAALVADYMEDLTTPEEYERARQRREERRLNIVSSPPVKPEKRDRRRMEEFLEQMRQSHGGGE